jgi:uroporphyrinogen-III synthase
MPKDTIVILTREPEDNAVLEEKLAQEGIKTLSYPCISTRVIPYEGYSICGKSVSDFKIIAFTSKRAVAGMERVWRELKNSDAILAAVGNRTAEEIKARIGRKAEIIGKKQTGESLAKAIIARFNQPVSVLYVRGNKTTDEFKSLLQSNGFQVYDLIVYENYAPELKPLELNQPAIVMFASPSAVINFYRVNPLIKNTVSAVAIGESTKKELIRLGFSQIRVASKPEPDYLVECVLKLVKEGEQK